MFSLFLSSTLPLSPQGSCPSLTFLSSVIHQTVLLRKGPMSIISSLLNSHRISTSSTLKSSKLFYPNLHTARNTRKHKSLCIAILTLSTHDVLDIFYSSLFNVLNVGWTFKLIKTKRMKNNELHSQCTVNQCTNREKVLKEIC